MRFAKSMNDAFFGFASMAVGAVSEVQQNAMQAFDDADSTTTVPPVASPLDPFGVLSWWPAFVPAPSAMAVATPPVFSWGQVWPAMQMWPGFSSNDDQNPWSAAFGAASGFNQMTANSFAAADMVKSFWPAAAWQPFSWTMYKWPMTAMMVSAGVPHAVASPAADAGMATMDAVDAAREQASLIFAFFGGDTTERATQSNAWPMAMFDLLPWYRPFQASAAA